MNRYILLAGVAIALAPAAWGQLYKYVDKDGKTVYTDLPPGNIDSKELKGPPPVPAAAGKPAAEKEVAKAPRPARDAGGKKPPMTCQAARENYAIFLDEPVTMRNTVTGERFQLDATQLEAEKAKAKGSMDAACKNPG